MLKTKMIYKGFFFNLCNVLSLAQCMAEDMDKGSDMQGTPPRDLREFSLVI